MKKILIVSTIAMVLCLNINAETTVKKLPEPDKKGGMPLMQALDKRKSTRSFDDNKKISDQTLSDLLWAGFGVNRPKTGKRTAPTSYNSQDILIYVFMENGTWLYNAEDNSLVLVSSKDLRELTGVQDFVNTAPVTLVFVSDYVKFEKANDTGKEYWNKAAAIHAGLVAQNINLFCASENLGAVVRVSIQYDELKKALKFDDNKMIVVAQTIGYKK